MDKLQQKHQLRDLTTFLEEMWIMQWWLGNRWVTDKRASTACVLTSPLWFFSCSSFKNSFSSCHSTLIIRIRVDQYMVTKTSLRHLFLPLFSVIISIIPFYPHQNNTNISEFLLGNSVRKEMRWIKRQEKNKSKFKVNYCKIYS